MRGQVKLQGGNSLLNCLCLAGGIDTCLILVIDHLFYVAMFVMLALTFLALAHIPNASYEIEALEAGDEFVKVCSRTVPKYHCDLFVGP